MISEHPLRARRPLSPSTLRRIAKGIEKYVLTGGKPFIVSLTHQGGDRVENIMEPARTITAAHRGEKAIVQLKYAYLSAALIPYYGSERDGQNIQSPCRTITTKDRFALAETFMDAEPLTPEKAEKARQVASWLRSQGVNIPGEFATVGSLAICDIGLRMLRPEECFLAQGFPKDYVIDRGILVDGSERIVELNCADQMRMCGNSVPPPVVKALVEANYYALPQGGKYGKAS